MTGFAPGFVPGLLPGFLPTKRSIGDRVPTATFQNRVGIDLTGLTLAASVPASWVGATYPVRIDLAHQVGMDADFADLRFVDADDTTELDHWVESYTASTSAVIWVEVPLGASATKTIYCYYNPTEAVSNLSDGKEVFEWFQDLRVTSFDVPFANNKGEGLPFYEINTPRGVYVASEDKTFIVFEGASNDGYAQYYDHASGTYSTPVLIYTSALVGDSHGNPVIVQLSDGKFMVWGGAHNSVDFQIFVSNSANSIAAWTDKTVNFGSRAGTYPNLGVLSTGRVVCLRRQGDHDTPWVECYSDDDGDTWSSDVTVLSTPLTGTPGDSWYFKWRQVGDEFHAVGVWHDHANSGETGRERYDAYYMKRESSGGWVDAAGSSITLPLSPTTAKASSVIRLYNSGSNETSVSDVLVVGGEPYVFWSEDTSGASTEIRFRVSRFTSGAWTSPATIQTVGQGRIYNMPAAWHDGSAFHVLTNPQPSGVVGYLGVSTYGDIWEYTSSDGATWTKAQEIVTVLGSNRTYRSPVTAIHNAHADFRAMWFDNVDTYVQHARIWVYGDSGLLGGSSNEPDGLKPDFDTQAATAGGWQISGNQRVIGTRRFGLNHTVRSKFSANEQDCLLLGWGSHGPVSAASLIAPYTGYYFQCSDSVADGVFTTQQTISKSAGVNLDVATVTGTRDIRTPAVWEVARLGSSLVMRDEDGAFQTYTGADIIPGSPDLAVTFGCFDSSVASTTTYEWMLVRKEANTEPTATPQSPSAASKTGLTP